MISTLGTVASHFAMTTFCWFPPDRSLTLRLGRSGRMDSSSMYFFASASRLLLTILPAVDTSWLLGRAMLSSMLMMRTRPERLRSSGTRVIPARMASGIPFALSSRPSIRIVPPVFS